MIDEQRLEQGRKIYNFRCYFCHGYSGDAKTVAAQQLDPPPRDFTKAKLLTEADILKALENGIPKTGMKSFKNVLSEDERAAVAAFVMDEFVRRQAPNTAYHTVENGWPDHAERYGAAFPFVRGEMSVTADPTSLDAGAKRGRQLYIEACITCHEPKVLKSQPAFEAFPLSHMGEVARDIDAVSSASVYAKHDRAPDIAGLSEVERRGKEVFEQNCAFCHAADGTGKNWIGSFLQPHPRNFTDPKESGHLDAQHLRMAIREGIPNTSMPAWGKVLTPDQAEAAAKYVEKAFLGQWRGR